LYQNLLLPAQYGLRVLFSAIETGYISPVHSPARAKFDRKKLCARRVRCEAKLNTGICLVVIDIVVSWSERQKDIHYQPQRDYSRENVPLKGPVSVGESEPPRIKLPIISEGTAREGS
jgi:hypothetical protein